MRNRFGRVLMVLAVVAGTAALALPARASFHLIRISEVFAGTTDHLAADFVELTMISSGQDNVNGSRLAFYDSDGNLTGTDDIDADLTDGDAGETILIASSEAATLFSVTADFTLDTSISGVGGKVCFEGPAFGPNRDVIDCASWGAFRGSSTGSGTPLRELGIPLGAAMHRKGSGASFTDTANSANDFVLRQPSPRNFAGTLGGASGGIFELSADELEITEGAGGLGIGVARVGNTTESGSVMLLATPDSARPNDFTLTPDTALQFGVDEDLEFVSLQVVDDDKFETDETFILSLDSPTDEGQSGSVLDQFVEMVVTIHDNEVDTVDPTSAIIKPADGTTYLPRELEVLKGTASDDGGIGLEKVQVALRKNMRSGGCRWFDGEDFIQRACSNRKFLNAAGRKNWSFDLGSRLEESKGTNVKNYNLFSRARDLAGNVEDTFDDPNSSFFEIARD